MGLVWQSKSTTFVSNCLRGFFDVITHTRNISIQSCYMNRGTPCSTSREPIPKRQNLLKWQKNLWFKTGNDIGHLCTCRYKVLVGQLGPLPMSFDQEFYPSLFARSVVVCVTRFRIRPSNVLQTSLPCVPHFSGRGAPIRHGKTEDDRKGHSKAERTFLFSTLLQSPTFLNPLSFVVSPKRVLSFALRWLCVT